MNGLSKDAATWREVGDEAAGQRIDNWLLRSLKGVPKTHVYRILRTGEVRVNSRRVDATFRLSAGDRIRVPPVRTAQPDAGDGEGRQVLARGARAALEKAILLEDEFLIVLDKPAGLAVHGGSGVSQGVIEQLRLMRPDSKLLELAHRLDRETSGVLLIAKKRSALVSLHDQFRAGQVRKIYLVLVKGHWTRANHAIEAPLKRYLTTADERRVAVDPEGQYAKTLFRRIAAGTAFSLLEAELLTGRTHQIRVHLAHAGYPIAGDDKYGDYALNRQLARKDLKRMFLHAARTTFRHPGTGEKITLTAELPPELAAARNALVGTAGGRPRS